jgi:hypothetical protein
MCKTIDLGIADKTRQKEDIHYAHRDDTAIVAVMNL